MTQHREISVHGTRKKPNRHYAIFIDYHPLGKGLEHIFMVALNVEKNCLKFRKIYPSHSGTSLWAGRSNTDEAFVQMSMMRLASSCDDEG
jgi:hypothetical protein